MSRYITEKKFEHRNWFLFYPEEGNTRGAPTDLLRFHTTPQFHVLNNSREMCAGVLSLELRQKRCCTSECAPMLVCTPSSSKGSARFSHLITVWILSIPNTQAKEYKPSEEFVDNRWRNAWNAVYVAGGWRLVQPNWAAMQVQTKVGRILLVISNGEISILWNCCYSLNRV